MEKRSFKRGTMITGAVLGTFFVIATLAIGLNVVVYSMMSESMGEELESREEVALNL